MAFLRLFSKPFRLTRVPPTPPANPDVLLRNALVLTIDVTRNFIDMLELVNNPLVEQKTKDTLAADTLRVVANTLDALLEIEKATRPRLTPNADVPYLAYLYSLPDAREDQKD